jgi:protein TonB
MSLSTNENNLYLAITVSLLLHVVAFLVFTNLPQAEKLHKEEPIMVDLADIPDLKPQQKTREAAKAARQADVFRRVPVETAPKGMDGRDKPAPAPVSRPQQARSTRPGLPAEMKPVAPQAARPSRGEEMSRPVAPSESIFRSKPVPKSDIATLYPSAGRLAKIEESYRKKYGNEVQESDTKFLNTDDIQFGSFLRRFETAVYGVWRYPAEAARLGIEGITPVRITFNRKGVIEKVELLESSGSRILDDEVRRTLGMIGPVGSFPRNYDQDKFHLIAFFHYGISGGSRPGRLY